MKDKSCAFTGHRPEKLPFPMEKGNAEYDRLEREIFCSILRMTREGITVFISGMAKGIDQIAAEIVLQLRDNLPECMIQLWAAIPYDRQPTSWTPQDRLRYEKILERADKVEYINHDYHKGCLHERDRWMVDRASYLLAVFNGTSGGTKYTVDYARKKGLNITIIEP